MSWTGKDIANQSGKNVIVTGASSGLGLITAGELARRGARVVLAVRNTGKGEEAAARMRSAAPEADITVARLELSDLASVREFAEQATGLLPDGIDLLVNNAGVMAIPFRRTADGFEMQLGTNHLGHFALTGLLVPELLRRPKPRVVTVSSNLHERGEIDFENLNSEQGYTPWGAYAQSKLANLLFAFELQRRAAGTQLLSVAAHPGYASTNLQGAGPEMTGNKAMAAFFRVGNALFAQRAEWGALPVLYAATAETTPPGGYIGPNGFRGMRGYPELVDPSPKARDEEVAARLWQVSETLTGVKYSFDK